MENSILIYVNQLNARMLYTFRFIFRILNVPYRFTTKLEEFVAYNGPKFSYTRARLANEFHIHDAGLLHEKGIRPQNIMPGKWDDLPVIFHTNENASIPFDLLSAAFFLISRYEEYLTKDTDEHDRFSYKQSLAYRYGFLDKPLIDIWLEKFKRIFEAQNPAYRFPPPVFYFRPLLNVSISHLFKHKGLIRHIGGMADNLFHLQFKNLMRRLIFIFTKKRDPYDTFYKIIALKKQYSHPLISFFLVGSFSDFDHNISLTRPAYRRIIKTMADYSDIGLMISYHHSYDEKKIKKERQSLENLIHKPVEKVHFHYYRQKIPLSYKLLYKLEFKEDFSCGYPKHSGYRASTAFPYPFYDLENEEPTDLTVHPIVITDYQLNFIEKLSPNRALQKLKEIGDQIKKTGGYFQPVFHNSILSEFEEWENWSNVYIKLLEEYAK